MKQDNNILTTRELAQIWWEDKFLAEQQSLVNKHYPLSLHFAENASPEIIDRIYLSEHPEQSLPEETIKEESSNREEGDILDKFIVEIENEFKDMNLDYLPFVAERVREKYPPAFVHELVKENQALRESNTRLKERIEVLESVLNECYGYFSAPNFTDRYGTADRIKEALNNNNHK